jgi:hypothetical protein
MGYLIVFLGGGLGAMLVVRDRGFLAPCQF